MKLEKFYAETMAQAMSIIQKKLGPNAVIYSQDKKNHLIEVVAGLPSSAMEQTKKSSQILETHDVDSDYQSEAQSPDISSQSSSISNHDNMERIKKLDNSAIRHEVLRMERRNMLFKKLLELRFSYEFIEQFVESYSSHCELEDIRNNDQIIKLMLSKLKTNESELIDEKRIVALVGPTGVGKSTTIAKLARRFIAKYGSEQLGIISTDFQRIITKNQFYYFGQLLSVQVEYARDMTELQQCIQLLDDKKLILIDTAGVNQYDNQKIAAFCETIQIETENISLYMVLPCNLQTDALDQMIKNFDFQNTMGCILTKKDECKTIAPALSSVMLNDLPIDYICDGQNIVKDINPANKLELVSHVLA